MTRRTRRPAATTVGWLLTLPLAGAAAARLRRYDGHAVFSAFNAGTPFVYLPAYGGFVVGARHRRPALTAVAGAVVACHLAWTVPEAVRGRSGRASGDDSPGARRLRVVTANVRFTSRQKAALGRELAASRADLLFLQELGEDHLIALKAAGAFDRYPYSVVDARSGSFGGGIWSRYPLSEGDAWANHGVPVVRATLDVDGVEVRLFNAHVKAPSRTRWIGVWKAQLAELGRQFQAERRPVIIAGDFNATYGHQPFRDLLATGLREAHMEVGRGLATTWPRGGRVFPPFFRLDHVLVSPDVEVLSVAEGRGKGSDHRPVVADVAVRP